MPDVDAGGFAGFVGGEGEGGDAVAGGETGEGDDAGFGVGMQTSQWIDWRTGLFDQSPGSPYLGANAGRQPITMSEITRVRVAGRIAEHVERHGPADLSVVLHGGEPLLAQARRAARSGVGLDTVLRRYVAGHGLLSDFLVQETEGRLAPAELKRLFRRLAATLDCLLNAVTTAYRLEERRSHRTAAQRRGELVERLLGGEPLDAAEELGYGLETRHLGLVAAGQTSEHRLGGAVSRSDVAAHGLLSWAPNFSAWIRARCVRSPPEMPVGKPR